MNETVAQETKQYLTFKLGEEIFGIDVIQIKEILEYTKITKIPQTPDFMRGVINLRGNVVPVIDMKLKFGMEQIVKTVNTCIIVMEIEIGNEKTFMGALVDSVQEVFELEPEDIEAPPRIGTKIRSDFIKGMGKKGDKFIILLNINKVFSVEELEIVQQKSLL